MKNGELELRPTDIINGSEPKITNGNSERNENGSWLSKLRAAIAFLTIEPYLICYILPNAISSIAVQTLNLDKACRVDLGHTKEECDAGNDTISIAIQSTVADMTTWQVPMQSAIPAIFILFVGAWSDRTGNRKALMLVPMCGELISAFGLVLTTYYFEEWPLFVTALIESLPTALSGGFSIALMGSFSYLADVTSLESRTFRMGIVAVIVTLGAPVALAISGVLLTAIGYYGIFGLTTTLYALGLLYTYFRIHNQKPVKTDGTLCQKLINFIHPRNAWDTLYLIFKKSPNRTKILLVIAAHIVIIGPVLGEGALLYQYMVYKFDMDGVEISLYFTYSILVGLCGTAIAVTLFSKFMKMHDALLGIIATTCKVMSSIVFALAPTKPWFYSGPAFDFFGGTAVTAIRSLGTKVVTPEEVAKMCSLIGLVEAITPVIYTPIYSQMYKATLETLPGAFYLLGGGMTIPAFFIFITLYVLHKKEERDKVKNPESKERYAHENDVTAF